MVLDDGPAPGTPLTEVLPVAEPVLELEVTPNRVDCFGVYGVAREVHAISGAPLAPEPWAEDAVAEGEGEAGDYASVDGRGPRALPALHRARLHGRGDRPLAGLAAGAAQRRRAAADQQRRRHHQLRDAADRAAAARLRPRPRAGRRSDRAHRERGREDDDARRRRAHASTPRRCWSATSDGPSGIAGIMGGQVSEVSEATTRVLLEVANWNGTNILRTSRLLGLRSEASSRFEKQLHPALCMRAQRIASRLMVELCGAKLVPGTIDVAAEMPAPPPVRLRGERVERAARHARSRRPTRSPTSSGSASASRRRRRPRRRPCRRTATTTSRARST